MADESAARPKRLGGRDVAVPLVTLAAVFASWRLGLRWPLIPIAALLIGWYLVLPRLVRSREARFHREALRLLATGRADAVPALARRQLLLQLFGSSGPIDGIIGIALAQTERWPAAAAHLESASRAATGTDAAALRASLTKALFATGDLERARDEGMALVETGLQLPEVLVLVARAHVGLGRADDRAAPLLAAAEGLSPSADVRMMIELTRIEARLASGRKLPPLDENADSGQRFVRAWIHFVRGRLREHRGDLDGAAASYGKAVREAGEEVPVFAALAHSRLGPLAGSAAPSRRRD